MPAMPAMPPARLVLDDGSFFDGYSFGAPTVTSGEVVFTTGMTGYPQSLSDPSFHGQILVCTYPLLGNYGIPVASGSAAMELDGYGIPLRFESERVQVAGLVVSECCDSPSHYAAGMTLSDWLASHGVPGIAGIDTRALTQRLRGHGTMHGRIVPASAATAAVAVAASGPGHAVAAVSPRIVQVLVSTMASNMSGTTAGTMAGNLAITTSGSLSGTMADSTDPGRQPRIALLDCGAKANILRCLLDRGATVIRLPWDHDLSGIEYDGLLLSNGPGDPKACGRTIASVRRAFHIAKPIFGICLGNQIMALAAGADTYKLPYGHRGQNQPCVELPGGRCHITSQNHGYAVRADSLPAGWEPWFINANDSTVEGIRCSHGPFAAVQFHPEGCPGPRDSEYLLDDFLALVRRQAGLTQDELTQAELTQVGLTQAGQQQPAAVVGGTVQEVLA